MKTRLTWLTVSAFCFLLPPFVPLAGAGSIQGIKWNDANRNGVVDVNNGEEPLADWTIYLDLNRNGNLDESEPTATTNENGEYGFPDLPAGPYPVREILKPGWVQTYPLNRQCFGFGTLELGTRFQAGQTVEIQNDQGFTLPFQTGEFFFSNGESTREGFIEVQNNGMAGGAGHELAINNITLAVNLEISATEILFQFGEFGGNINLQINGELANVENFAELDGQSVGDAAIEVFNGSGQDAGLVKIVGELKSLGIGGQELWIDDLCFRFSPQLTELNEVQTQANQTGGQTAAHVIILDENQTVEGVNFGNRSEFFIEHDVFEETRASITINNPDGGEETVALSGPSRVDVFFEGDAEGVADDDDGDGNDEVRTQMIELNLTGQSSMGPVRVRLNPQFISEGEIEERNNATAGLLDLAPFADEGTADSFFDIYVEITVETADGTVVLHNRDPKVLRNVIYHKPPQPGSPYQSPQIIELFLPNGEPSGFFLGTTRHIPSGGVIEHDVFEETRASITINNPDGGEETVALSGPSRVDVFFEGDAEGVADDDDGDGNDEVRTQMIELNLTGQSSMGPVRVRLNPQFISEGEIEERNNATAGLLDLPPFADEGTADSFFDIWTEITIGEGDNQVVLHHVEPKRLSSVIAFKPPEPGATYESPEQIELLLPNGEPSGFSLGPTRHVPRHFVEHDIFEQTQARIVLLTAEGEEETVNLSGPSAVDVWFESAEGQARDDDGDGLDEVMTKMVELNLSGSSSLGPVQVRLNPNMMSTGEIEERENNTPGLLDVPPFAETGSANSFFDVFVEIAIETDNGPVVLHNRDPKVLRNVIFHKPPQPGSPYQSPQIIELLLPNGEPSGFFLGTTRHIPNGGVIEHDIFEETRASITLTGPTGTQEEVALSGPSAVDVFFEGDTEGVADDDDGDGNDEVRTQMMELNLTGESSMGPVRVRLNPRFISEGEIEERNNANAGLLDLAPFADEGTADSFFDIWTEITIGEGDNQLVLHHVEPKRLSSIIAFKPPEPGATYEAPERIELLLPDGTSSGFFLGPTRHVPRHFVEHDVFEQTQARIVLRTAEGDEETVNLSGPSAVDVWFESAEGEARDDDGNGRDEVMTRMVELNLTGESSMGPVQVTLNPNIPSTGIIEERVNNTPGLLDIPPFADTGSANSFFDVFVEITVETANGPAVLHNEEAKRLRTVIYHKPPQPGSVYQSPQIIELFGPDGEPTGLFLGTTRHIPNGGVIEHDIFEETRASITITGPDGTEESVALSGPSAVDVFFEGDTEGVADDDDGDGNDEVRTQMIELNLTGESSMGPVRVRLNPQFISEGEIEERNNANAGLLDLAPFADEGTADSFFDIWTEITIGEGDNQVVLHHVEPKRLRSVIAHKPPEPGATYQAPERIELLLPDGTSSGFFLGPTRHVPRHFVEHDIFEETRAQIVLRTPDGDEERVALSGPSAVDVWFEAREGQARDDDGNGRDEVMTKMVELNLTGESSMGPVQVTLNPDMMSTGVIEERANNTPGLLDIPPFADSGNANSFFDVFVEITVETENGPVVLHNRDPKRLRTIIFNKPPEPGAVYQGPQIIELFLPNGEPSGFSLGTTRHVPNGEVVEHDVFEQTSARITLTDEQGTLETVSLQGPSTVDVFFEGNAEGDADDDDGNGLDEVRTRMVELRLAGTSSMGTIQVRLNPDRLSTGMIEEKENANEGILDIPPFTDAGGANSFFDIFVEVEITTFSGERILLHNEEPKQLSSMIFHKPPEPGAVYEGPDRTELHLPDGSPSGFFLGPTTHEPNHFVEHDVFEQTRAQITLLDPQGNEENVLLQGPSQVDVWFEGREGDAHDNNGNRLDEVRTKLVELNLTGTSSMGTVQVRLNPNRMSRGIIEEKENATPGTLDLPPFTESGGANSFFDVFFEIVVTTPDGEEIVLHNRDPKVLRTMIFHKPPEPGAVYESPEIIELYLPNGEPSGFRLGPTTHSPNHFVEHDIFEQTRAEITVTDMDGNEETVLLQGPSAVDVWFEGLEGEAGDDDGNGLDEVRTKLVELQLTGTSSLGTVELRLNPDIMSTGVIEEKENNTPGILDLPPFTETGGANSSFEVYFIIVLTTPDGEEVILHNEDPKVLRSMIFHKPPEPGAVYESPERIELLLPDGSSSGFFLERTTHTPNHFVEHDIFEQTRAQITVMDADGNEETVLLQGPSAVDVWFEGNEGDAGDDDGNGLDEVRTKLVDLQLTGTSSMGSVRLRLNPNIMSTGVIEETDNANPGTLDVPPFTESGSADSFFDVFFELELTTPDGEVVVLHNDTPKVLRTVISHKPPEPGAVYESPEQIDLLLPDGTPSGFILGPTSHRPNHFVEHDIFERTRAEITLMTAEGQTETVALQGPAAVDVWFEGGEGDAGDDDGNGLDEVRTKLVDLVLTGTSSMGPVKVRLNPNLMSTGVIEEKENNNPGTLDLPPFTETGGANSFFDVFFEIILPGPDEHWIILHNEDPKKLETMISHKPPEPGAVYESPEQIELFLPDGEPSGFFLGPAFHAPSHFVEHDIFEGAEAEFTLFDRDGNPETVRVQGTTAVDVWFEAREGEAQDDNGNRLDEVDTLMVDLNMTGSSSMGTVQVRLNPNRRSTGLIEEIKNANPGILDLPPFTETGGANSFFDVFFELTVPGPDGEELLLHNRDPKVLRTMIAHKPPESDAAYESPEEIELFLPNGEPSGFTMGPAIHTPNPMGAVEHDRFEMTHGRMQLILPDGEETVVNLRGPLSVDVFFEGPEEGIAFDNDGNDREEVQTEMVALDLVGFSPLGRVRVRLNPDIRSTGVIEEMQNNIQGLLDLPPFANEGRADSYFDAYFEIEITSPNGEQVVLRNSETKRLSAVLSHKPPLRRTRFGGEDIVELQLPDGQPSGYSLGTAFNIPNPIRIDRIRRVSQGIELEWEGPGVVLERADQPTGPWQEVQDAASPFVVTPDNQQGYYRLREVDEAQ